MFNEKEKTFTINNNFKKEKNELDMGNADAFVQQRAK
jgi:hypothetical protein